MCGDILWMQYIHRYMALYVNATDFYHITDIDVMLP